MKFLRIMENSAIKKKLVGKRLPYWKRKFRFKTLAYVRIMETTNNIFVGFYNKERKLLIQSSGGHIPGMKGAKRRTPLAGELLGKKIGKEILLRKYYIIAVKVKGRFTGVVRGVLRGLLLSKIRFSYMEEIKGLVHNGVRKKKKRRM